MSTADDAWQEFKDAHPETEWTNEILLKAPFMAGYRRALEDAANAQFLQHRAEGFITYKNPPPAEFVQNWLRDRAAGVGTKDGDDDE